MSKPPCLRSGGLEISMSAGYTFMRILPEATDKEREAFEEFIIQLTCAGISIQVSREGGIPKSIRK